MTVQTPAPYASLWWKVGTARNVFRNWLWLGTISRLGHLAHRVGPLRLLSDRVNDIRVRPRLRSGGALVTRCRDLGGVFDVFMLRCYDLPQIRWADVATVIDCGANIGAFTVWAEMRSSCQVMAIEPSRTAFSLLEKNAATFSGRVQTLQAAVTAGAGVRTFYESYYPTNSSLVPWRAGWDPGLTQYEVDCLTLPDVIARSGFTRIGLLKLDIEGAEAEIFESLAPGSFDAVDRVVIEVHQTLGGNIAQIVKVLEAAGFAVSHDSGYPEAMLVATRN